MPNQGDILKHRHLAGITVELVEPTNRGWKVIQREERARGKTKEKTAYFTSLDLFGDHRGDGSLFEPIKESNMKYINNLERFITESKSKQTPG